MFKFSRFFFVACLAACTAQSTHPGADTANGGLTTPSSQNEAYAKAPIHDDATESDAAFVVAAIKKHDLACSETDSRNGVATTRTTRTFTPEGRVSTETFELLDPSINGWLYVPLVSSETTFDYDGQGRLLATRYHSSEGDIVETYTYEASGAISSKQTVRQSQSGHSIVTLHTWKYDADGREIERSSSGNDVWSYLSTYDAQGRLVSEAHSFQGKPSRGKSWTFDGQGRLVSTREEDFQRAIVTFETYTHSTAGAHVDLLWYLQGLLGYQSRRDLDPAGKLLRQIDDYQADGSEDLRTEIVYDSKGNSVHWRQVAGSNVTETFTSYDANSRIIEFVSPPNLIERYSYDAAGNQTENRTFLAGLLSTVVSRAFDAANSLLWEEIDRDADGKADWREENTYDQAGNRLSHSNNYWGLDKTITADFSCFATR